MAQKNQKTTCAALREVRYHPMGFECWGWREAKIDTVDSCLRRFTPSQ